MVILTRNVVWITKLYWNHMGITNKKKYNVQEDVNNKTSIINLIENNNKEEYITYMESNKSEKQSTKINKIEAEENKKLPCWQRNLQTFYNPIG